MILTFAPYHTETALDAMMQAVEEVQGSIMVLNDGDWFKMMFDDEKEARVREILKEAICIELKA